MIDEQASVRQEHCTMHRPNIVSSLCAWAVQYRGVASHPIHPLWIRPGIFLIVRYPFIHSLQADILVCSVGSKFNLSIGAIAIAMSKAAGPALQEALRELKDVTADLGEGDTIHTSPGKLPCRHVIHCVCCPWKGNADPEQMRLRRKMYELR